VRGIALELAERGLVGHIFFIERMIIDPFDAQRIDNHPFDRSGGGRGG
jgi:hypothetical protein